MIVGLLTPHVLSAAFFSGAFIAMSLLGTNRSTVDLWLAVSGYCAGAGALASSLVAAILVIGWREHRRAFPWLIVHFAASILIVWMGFVWLGAHLV